MSKLMEVFPLYPPVVYLTDCTDSNAQARLSARIAALFGQSPSLCSLAGVDPETSASLTLLDTLRAADSLGENKNPVIVLVNVAPRDGRWPNGAPFCYFWYCGQLVVSTYSQRTLALVRDYLGIKEVYVTDIGDVLRVARSWTGFDEVQIEQIATSQFRSLWYQPLLAKWLVDRREIPAVATGLPPSMDDTVRVAVIDNFGNCKLNCRGSDVGFLVGAFFEVPDFSRSGSSVRKVQCYDRLTAVPEGEPGLIIGSSGYDFIELVVRRGSAAREFQLHEGAPFCLRRTSEGSPRQDADTGQFAAVAEGGTKCPR
jgi:S-adenosyl-l-methionine hydroxide adenosyltransferase